MSATRVLTLESQNSTEPMKQIECKREAARA